MDALKIQVEEDLKYKTHRLIGEILMDRDCITAQQIQEVLGDIFRR